MAATEIKALNIAKDTVQAVTEMMEAINKLEYLFETMSSSGIDLTDVTNEGNIASDEITSHCTGVNISNVLTFMIPALQT
jgi:hypothetical protein